MIFGFGHQQKIHQFKIFTYTILMRFLTNSSGPHYAGGLHNAIIYPLRHFTVRGALWDHGLLNEIFFYKNTILNLKLNTNYLRSLKKLKKLVSQFFSVLNQLQFYYYLVIINFVSGESVSALNSLTSTQFMCATSAMVDDWRSIFYQAYVPADEHKVSFPVGIVQVENV